LARALCRWPNDCGLLRVPGVLRAREPQRHDGPEQRLDWPSSWRPQKVGPREWEELKRRVRREYEALIEILERLETWSEQQVGDSLAIAAHTAYHLGAIRHALKNLDAVL